jgi:nitrogen fixation protein FixH
MTATLTGKHALIIFAGAFAIVAGVNGVFVWAAVSTFSGLAGDDGYRKGLAYNSTLSEAAIQQRLGWKAALTIDNASSLTLVLTDAAGVPLSGYDVAGWFERPAASQWDRRLSFAPTSPGHYGARLNATGYGSWIATLTVSRPGAGIIFRWKERLWLPPQG